MTKGWYYGRRYKSIDNVLSNFSMDVLAYDGEGDTDWAYDESGNLLPNMRRVCTLHADLSGLRETLKVQKGSDGQDFWLVNVLILVNFGGTPLRASVRWWEGVSISHFHQ